MQNDKERICGQDKILPKTSFLSCSLYVVSTFSILSRLCIASTKCNMFSDVLSNFFFCQTFFFVWTLFYVSKPPNKPQFQSYKVDANQYKHTVTKNTIHVKKKRLFLYSFCGTNLKNRFTYTKSKIESSFFSVFRFLFAVAITMHAV